MGVGTRNRVEVDGVPGVGVGTRNRLEVEGVPGDGDGGPRNRLQPR